MRMASRPTSSRRPGGSRWRACSIAGVSTATGGAARSPGSTGDCWSTMTSPWSATATAPARNGSSSVSMTSGHVELHCHSHYSFLEGASHPDELVARARDLEMPALAITDRNGFYGAVKFFGAAQRAGLQPIVGTELTIDDGSRPPKDRVDYDRWGDRLLLLAEDKVGYMNLCLLISMAQMPNAKGMARLASDDLAGVKHPSDRAGGGSERAAALLPGGLRSRSGLHRIARPPRARRPLAQPGPARPGRAARRAAGHHQRDLLCDTRPAQAPRCPYRDPPSHHAR